MTEKARKYRILQQAAILNQEYQTLEKGLQEKSEAMGNELHTMTKLIFENMFIIIRQQQDFVSKAMQLLDSQE